MKVIGILIAGVVASVAGAADPDPVDLRVRLMGPSGPLAHVWMKADYGSAETAKAETDDDGWATWHLDRKIGRRVAVGTGALPELNNELYKNYAQRVDTYRKRFAGIALPSSVLVELPAEGTIVEKTLVFSRGIVLSFGPVTNPNGSIARLVSLHVSGAGTVSLFDDRDGMGSLMGVPADTTTVAYLEWAESDDFGRSMRISVPNSGADISLGAIQLPAPIEPTAKVVVTRTGMDKKWPARAYMGLGQVGVTLVSADGTYITDGLYSTPAVDNKMKLSLKVPPGTYYVLPGMFTAHDFQSALIEKLVAGADLSGNSALPRVTVAAQETKELEYCDVDVINAIYELPLAGK